MRRDEALRELVRNEQMDPDTNDPREETPARATTTTTKTSTTHRQRISEAAHGWLPMCGGIMPSTKDRYRRALELLETFTGGCFRG